MGSGGRKNQTIDYDQDRPGGWTIPPGKQHVRVVNGANGERRYLTRRPAGCHDVSVWRSYDGGKRS